METGRINILFSLLVGLCLLGIQCKNASEQKVSNTREVEEKSSLDVETFGTTPEGKTIEKYVLRNQLGMEVSIITYGGRIVSLKIPDKKGEYEDVVLGFDSLDDYTKDNPFFGALIGRYGNRIENGKFSLDGKEYILAKKQWGKPSPWRN